MVKKKSLLLFVAIVAMNGYFTDALIENAYVVDINAMNMEFSLLHSFDVYFRVGLGDCRVELTPEKELFHMMAALHLLVTKKPPPWVLFMLIYVKFLTLQLARFFSEAPYNYRTIEGYGMSEIQYTTTARMAHYLIDVGQLIPLDSAITALSEALKDLARQRVINIDEVLEEIQSMLTKYQENVTSDLHLAIVEKIENNQRPTSPEEVFVFDYRLEAALSQIFSTFLFKGLTRTPLENFNAHIYTVALEIFGVRDHIGATQLSYILREVEWRRFLTLNPGIDVMNMPRCEVEWVAPYALTWKLNLVTDAANKHHFMLDMGVDLLKFVEETKKQQAQRGY